MSTDITATPAQQQILCDLLDAVRNWRNAARDLAAETQEVTEGLASGSVPPLRRPGAAGDFARYGATVHALSQAAAAIGVERDAIAVVIRCGTTNSPYTGIRFTGIRFTEPA